MPELSPIIVREKILDLLSSGQAEFRSVSHASAGRSEDVAKVRGTRPGQGAKAMVFWADDRPAFLVLPGNRKVANAPAKKILACRNLRLMSPEEVTSYTGLVVGTVPPFGSTFGWVTYCDRRLTEETEIGFNLASLTESVVLKTEDYLRLERPVIEDFSVSLV